MESKFKVGQLVLHPDTKEPVYVTLVDYCEEFDCYFYELGFEKTLFGSGLIELVERQ